MKPTDKQAYLEEYELLKKKGKPFFPYAVLKDSAMEVRIYRTIANSHMANGIFAYAPAARVVAEGDLVDEGWDISFWGNSCCLRCGKDGAAAG